MRNTSRKRGSSWFGPARGAQGTLYQETLAPFGTRMGLHWTPVHVYFGCQDTKMATRSEGVSLICVVSMWFVRSN